MLTQHYKIPACADVIENGKPGQFVFEDDYSDLVIGFIDLVSDTELFIILFNPTDLSKEDFEFTHLAENVDWQARITEIMDADPEMDEMWCEAVVDQDDEIDDGDSVEQVTLH